MSRPLALVAAVLCCLPLPAAAHAAADPVRGDERVVAGWASSTTTRACAAPASR
jgi:hypothetical protein